VLRDHVEVRFRGRSQRKPLELLETLLAMGGREVSAARVAESLWPQSDEDSAADALVTTLHRLRKLLDQDATVTLTDARLTLDPRLVWVDAWAFDRSASEFESLAAVGGSPEAMHRAGGQALGHYRGRLLPPNEGGIGVIDQRERLHARFRRVAERKADARAALADWAGLLALCHRVLAIDPVAEPIYRALMRALAEQGRHGEALEVCRRAERVLRAGLGQAISPVTRSLCRSIVESAGNAS
jgi:LuxR family maltose regulon positive regulatory protein